MKNKIKEKVLKELEVNEDFEFKSKKHEKVFNRLIDLTLVEVEKVIVDFETKQNLMGGLIEDFVNVDLNSEKKIISTICKELKQKLGLEKK